MSTLKQVLSTANQLPRLDRKALAAIIQQDLGDDALSYDDARTLLGYQEAMRGEGYSVAEVRAYFEAKIASRTAAP